MFALFCIPWAANAQQSLPYSYGFENGNLATDGWTATSGGINSSGYHTGTYGFRFSYQVTSDVYLVSPVLSGGTNGIEVSFYYKAYSSSYPDHFNVGYTTDENVTDPSMFTYGSLVTSSTSWQEYTEILPAGTVRVAIKYDADNYDDGYYLYLDDFSFEAVSSCTKPTDLAIDYTEGATSATVTWRGDARSYNVDVNGTIEVVNGTSYTIRDLDPATTYAVKVQADCGDEQSSWVNAGSFTTPCPETFAIPYAYGFENAAGINCWTLSPSNNISLDDQDSEFAYSGNAFLFLNYTTTPPQYVISPELSGIENGLHVEFWYSQYNNGVETFQVGYSTTDNDPDSFTWGDEITASTTYQRFSANYPAETKYVAVKHTANDQYYLFLDDFLFEESASCLEPTGVQVADVTTTGATLSWNAGGEESAWDIFVTDDATILPNDATTPTVANIAENPYALTGLTSATTYYVYVRAICGENEISAWSSAAIFNTACDAMALPYTYDFEDATLPVCWNTIVENTSYTGINVMTAITQVLAFYMGTAQNPALVAVLPEVDAAYPLNGYQITFDACYANTSSGSMTSGKLGIGIMTDPTDVTTFELIEEVAITDDLSAFGSHTVMLNSYTGDGQYIAIKDIYTQTGYVLVDNIEVTELPSCLAPTALGASLTSTSAELSWTANSSETAWTLYWKESGATEYTEVANVTNPYTLEGLNSATAYEYYVVANCSETDQSEASEVYSFTTLCGSVTTFPWTETFNNLTVAYSIPNCWDNAEGTTTINSYKWCYNTKTSGNGMASNGHEGSCVVFDSYSNSNNNTNFLKTVPISLPSDQPMQLSFWYKNPTGGDFSVYISTDGGATHETALATGLTGVSAWTEHNPINLGNYAGQDVVIVFKGTSNYGSGDAYIYLDDVTVKAVPSCAIPTALAATTTNNSAELSWTANSGEDTWTVYYREVTPDKVRANEYSEVIVGENPYTLEDLNDATAYEFYVIANCSEEDNSEPSAVFTFTTKCDPITDFPWNEDFEDFQTSTYGVTLNEPCWVNEHLEGNGSYFFEVVSITNGDNSTNQLRLHDMSSGNLTKLVLPGMTLPNANFQFSIDVYRNNSYSTYTTEGIRVFASADGEIEGATELAFIPRVYSASSDVIPAENAADWYTYNLPIGMSGTCYIIIRGESKFGAATYMDNFEVKEVEIPGCAKILVDEANPEWNEDFEDDAAGITTPYTGILPACWSVPVEYTSAEGDVTPPQVYYKPDFNATDGGSYCFRMRYRSMVALPELDENVDLGKVRLGLYVRQSYQSYQLEIGVVTDIENPDESYTPVALANNSDKNLHYFECEFASVRNLTGEGRYIVFKNVGGSEGDLYCNNYLDDITLTYVDEDDQVCEIYPDNTEDFEAYVLAAEPDCWEVITEDAALDSETRPQVYGNFNTTAGGSKTLRLKNRCVYAMPEFMDGYSVSDFTMTFNLRQPKSIYRLQVGLVDEQGNFTALKTFKCSNTTSMQEMTLNFADYDCSVGSRVAFRNTLVPGTGRSTDYLDYSINYIDDINFVVGEEAKAAVSDAEAMDADLDVEVYPNPTTDVINVQCSKVNVQGVGIEIVDVYGKIITTVDQTATQINVSDLAVGMYFVRVTTDKGVVTKPFVKR